MKPKHLILFTAILCIGLFIEGLKKMAGMSNTPKTASYQESEERPFRISNQEISETTQHLSTRGMVTRGGFKLATVHKADVLPGADVLGAATAAATEKLAKASEDAKKKKKKKKKDPNGRDANKKVEEQVAKKIADEKKKLRDQAKNDSTIKTAAAPIATPIVPNTTADQDPQKGMSYQEWAKLILGRPQPENVTQLVQAYKTRRVSSEIFYNLLTAMMNESNVEQHKLAVSAADQVPSSQSYVFLFAVLKSEKPNTEVAEQAARALQTYSRINLISQLRQVFSSSINDSAFLSYSLEILDRSTQTYLEQRTTSTDPATTGNQQTDMSSTSPTQGENKNSTLQQLRRVYLPFIPVLEKLIQTQAANQNIVELAQRSLGRIKNIQVVQPEPKG